MQDNYQQVWGSAAHGANFAYVALLNSSGASFIDILILGRSLRQYSPDIPRVLFINAEYSSLQIEALGLFWDRVLRLSEAADSLNYWHAVGLTEYSRVFVLPAHSMACGDLSVLAERPDCADKPGYDFVCSEESPWETGKNVSAELREGSYLLKTDAEKYGAGLRWGRKADSMLHLIHSFSSEIRSLSHTFNYPLFEIASGSESLFGRNVLEEYPRLINFGVKYRPTEVLYNSGTLSAKNPDATYIRALHENEGLLNARFRSISSSGTRNRFVSAYRLWLIHASAVAERLGSYLGSTVFQVSGDLPESEKGKMVANV